MYPKVFFVVVVFTSFLICLQLEHLIFIPCYKCQQREDVLSIYTALSAAQLMFFSGCQELNDVQL